MSEKLEQELLKRAKNAPTPKGKDVILPFKGSYNERQMKKRERDQVDIFPRLTGLGKQKA